MVGMWTFMVRQAHHEQWSGILSTLWLSKGGNALFAGPISNRHYSWVLLSQWAIRYSDKPSACNLQTGLIKFSTT